VKDILSPVLCCDGKLCLATVGWFVFSGGVLAGSDEAMLDSDSHLGLALGSGAELESKEFNSLWSSAGLCRGA
jgi:hypothetical protein